MGFHTGAIARGQNKKALALELGAHRYIDSQAEDVAKVLTEMGGAKLILATVTNAPAMTAVIEGLGIYGKLLVVGASPEPIEVTPIQLLGARREIAGWPSGTAVDWEDTMRFSTLQGVKPMIETYPLEKAADAYARMMCGKARFRVVLVLRRGADGASWFETRIFDALEEILTLRRAEGPSRRVRRYSAGAWRVLGCALGFFANLRTTT
jgi:D-arabinose 1-dehydrogenase-like Zn-dependent alcohol dehydrogenase